MLSTERSEPSTSTAGGYMSGQTRRPRKPPSSQAQVAGVAFDARWRYLGVRLLGGGRAISERCRDVSEEAARGGAEQEDGSKWHSWERPTATGTHVHRAPAGLRPVCWMAPVGLDVRSHWLPTARETNCEASEALPKHYGPYATIDSPDAGVTTPRQRWTVGMSDAETAETNGTVMTMQTLPARAWITYMSIELLLRTCR